MRKYANEVLRCIGYYMVMFIATAVMIPSSAQAAMNKISAITIGAALLINVYRMLLGGDESSFFTKLARRLTTMIFVGYILVFLAGLLTEHFGDLLQTVTNVFQ